jgi:hypothetical protein
MLFSRVPFWIAADLLGQARAHGVALDAEFSERLRGIVQGAQRDWMIERRDAEDARARDARRADSRRRGWF